MSDKPRVGAAPRPLAWLFAYDKANLKDDVVAGLTTAVMLVPQGMGYAMLAGLPPIVGLYAALVPLIAYAILGTSRKLGVGPVAMDSLLVAVSLSALADKGSDQYIAMAALLGVMVGIIQWAMGTFGLGFLVNFLSRPVVSGFTSAAALIIASSQLTHMLQVPLPRTHHVHTVVYEALEQQADWNYLALAIGIGSVVAMVLLKRYAPSFPRALFAIAVGTLAVVAFGWADTGLGIVGQVPAGLPSLQLPTLDMDMLLTLLPAAFTIAFVSFLEAISVGTRLARDDGEDLNANRELVALGVANVGGGLFGGYPIAGGLSRSAVNASAGAKTQMSGLVTAAVVALTLLFLTPLFHDMPKAALSAVIMTAVAGLIDTQEPRRLWKVKRNDFWLLVFTFVATLVLGVQNGIAAGVGASLLLFVVLTTRPHLAVLGRIPGTEAYLNVKRHPHAERIPGAIVARLDAQFYFGNVSFLKQTLAQLEADAEQPVASVVLDFSGVNQLDSSAEAALQELDQDYRERGVRLFLSRVKGPVRDVMFKSGLLQRLDGERRIFFRTHDAVQAATSEGLTPTPSEPPKPDPRAPADQIGCGRYHAANP